MFSFLSRLSSTETFSHFYTLTFLINMFYLKAFSSVSWWDASFWYILKNIQRFFIFSHFVLKVNLKVSSFSPSALVWTHFGSEAWNCSHQWRFDICIFESLKLDQDRHLDSSLLSSHISRRLFYFILFYFFYFFTFVRLLPTFWKFPSTSSFMWLWRFWAVCDIYLIF